MKKKTINIFVSLGVMVLCGFVAFEYIDQSFTCVWEMEHVPGRRWRAVVSPRFPDSVFLCKKDLDTGEYECYKITKAADKPTDSEEAGK